MNNSRSCRTTPAPKNVELAKRCLALIRDIAERGALSWDPADVGYALQELSQVLLERTGADDVEFEPITAEAIQDLDGLLVELQWVEGFSRELSTGHRCH